MSRMRLEREGIIADSRSPRAEIPVSGSNHAETVTRLRLREGAAYTVRPGTAVSNAATSRATAAAIVAAVKLPVTSRA